MTGILWEAEKFLQRKSEFQDCLASSGKVSGEIVPRNINEGPV